MSYPKCKHIKRSKPVHEENEEVSKKIAQDAQILPLFEKGLFEHAFIKNYSLQRNELLRCKWQEYVQSIETRVFAPFQFPDIRDLHFNNYAVRIRREDTFLYHNHRFRLRPGPGVDYSGQMPIPQDAIMKRSSSTPGKKAGNKINKHVENKDGGKDEKIDGNKSGKGNEKIEGK